MNSNINGVIYYKLDVSTNGYTGDYTKNCGLKGEEIDGNFNFLRGHDIKSISFDDKNNLVINRYDGSVLTAQKTEDDEYTFAYNSKHGILTIVTPKGENILLDGFYVEKPLYHDFTLNGTGLVDNPLKISTMAKTGRYFPAIKLIDTEFETLPTENIAKFDRYVTKEKIDRFGKLYSLKTISEYQKKLEEINSKWRVPTKEDWDSLFNFIDCENPEHGDINNDEHNDCIAGAALKSIEYWEPFNGKVLSDDAYGFSVLPVGYANESNNIINDSFGKITGFWTQTKNENSAYVKIFNHDSEGVGQELYDDNIFFSLRLVKDCDTTDIYDSEVIDNTTVKCLHIDGHNLVWSKENININDDISFPGLTPDKWNEYKNIETIENSYDSRFFINEWDGIKWNKQEITEGVGVILYEGEFGRMHEWMVIDGTLTDVTEFIKPEFSSEIKRVDDLIDNQQEQIMNVLNGLTTESETRETAVSNLSNSISDLSVKLETESIERKNTDDELNNELTNILNDIKEYIDESLINTEGSLKTSIDEINTSIDTVNNKIDLLTENDDRFDELLNSVNEQLTLEVNTINENINNNINTVNSRIDEEVESINDIVDSKIIEVNNEINECKNEIISSKNELTQEIDNVSTSSQNYSNLIKTDLENKINENVTNINDLNNKIQIIENNLNIILNKLNDLTTKFDVNFESLSKSVEDNKNDIDKLDNRLDAKANSLDTKINNLDNETDNKITSLNNDVYDKLLILTKDIADVKNDVNLIKKDAIYNIKGTDYEINVSPKENNTVTVGFAPEAIFVAG